jgi:hypothetical protein
MPIRGSPNGAQACPHLGDCRVRVRGQVLRVDLEFGPASNPKHVRGACRLQRFDSGCAPLANPGSIQSRMD